jgi:opacity protein-like surface antigen
MDDVMSAERVSFLAGAAALVSTATLAADFPPPLPPPVAVEGGWYLRGDIGMGQLHSKQLEFIPNQFDARIDFVIEHSAFSDQRLIGSGVGYARKNWLRFDLTGEYRSRANLPAWAATPFSAR